jgi:hypothetical protein
LKAQQFQKVTVYPLPISTEVLDTYTYDLRTTLIVREAGGCLTTKKGGWCGVVLVRCGPVFVDLFHFWLLLVTFFTVRKFYKLLFIAETGVKFVTFFTVCNFLKLLFTVEKGQRNCFISYIHCSGGRGVP